MDYISLEKLVPKIMQKYAYLVLAKLVRHGLMTFLHVVPKLIQVIQNDKTPKETIDYFTPEWELVKMRQNYPNSEKPLSKPKLLNKMLRLSEKLSVGFLFCVRISI